MYLFHESLNLQSFRWASPQWPCILLQNPSLRESLHGIWWQLTMHWERMTSVHGKQSNWKTRWFVGNLRVFVKRRWNLLSVFLFIILWTNLLSFSRFFWVNCCDIELIKIRLVSSQTIFQNKEVSKNNNSFNYFIKRFWPPNCSYNHGQYICMNFTLLIISHMELISWYTAHILFNVPSYCWSKQA